MTEQNTGLGEKEYKNEQPSISSYNYFFNSYNLEYMLPLIRQQMNKE